MTWIKQLHFKFNAYMCNISLSTAWTDHVFGFLKFWTLRFARQQMTAELDRWQFERRLHHYVEYQYWDKLQRLRVSSGKPTHERARRSSSEYTISEFDKNAAWTVAPQRLMSSSSNAIVISVILAVISLAINLKVYENKVLNTSILW